MNVPVLSNRERCFAAKRINGRQRKEPPVATTPKYHLPMVSHLVRY